VKLILRILAALFGCIAILLIGLVVHANIRIDGSEQVAADVAAPGRFVSVDQRRWHVLTMGDPKADASGAPVLLIHGFSPAGHLMWGTWPDRLAPSRSLIIPDLLGYGHSERDTEPGKHYTIKSYADSLARILDELGVAQVDIIGHSYGGATAARLALDYPTRVRRVVFIASPLYYERSAADNLIQWPLGIGRAIAWHVVTGGPASIIKGFCESQASERCLRLLKVKDTTDTIRAMMYTYHHTPDAEALVKDLPRIASPSRVIWGAEDPFFPSAQGERLARDTAADLVLIDGGGHTPYLSQADAVTDAVLTFFQGQ